MEAMRKLQRAAEHSPQTVQQGDPLQQPQQQENELQRLHQLHVPGASGAPAAGAPAASRAAVTAVGASHQAPAASGAAAGARVRHRTLEQLRADLMMYAMRVAGRRSTGGLDRVIATATMACVDAGLRAQSDALPKPATAPRAKRERGDEGADVVGHNGQDHGAAGLQRAAKRPRVSATG